MKRGSSSCVQPKLPRRLKFRLFLGFFDVFDDVADALELLGLFIRHFDAEFFFQRHDQLDGVERIRAEIFDKLGCRDDLFRLYTELFDDDIFYTLVNR